MEEKIFAPEPFGTVRAVRGLFTAELAIGEPWRHASSQVHRFPTTLAVTAPSRIAGDCPEEMLRVFREFPSIEELCVWLLELEPAILVALGFAHGFFARAAADRSVMRLLLALEDGVKGISLAALP